ncbi:type II toxin-antitoxin system HicA family toxin [Pseudobacillus badius]|uniref:type II toxin-antitoxin system HicA family toxin n=1 Tax=Bacillus badius TaxID=1455 RepID=UPI0007B08C9E|nr:type II toxin-antitoxin system HicA family toxin [Bacillus badius]KZN98598.1 hypothetical protein A4244_19600 [Bacillus badius]OCS83488.1 hypothetical protein A6M11_19615 [Bacillus badius]OVE46909.1 hypothetical protein B1A98_19055 [Bacillus badius]TDV98868.1 hypothetical protein B0G66_12521 [Bacillus badius]
MGLIILLSLVVGGCTAYFGAKEYDKTEESVTETPADKAPNSEANETGNKKEETVNKEKETAGKRSWLSKTREVSASDKTKKYGKQAVIDAVMEELNSPKTISRKELDKKLKKGGFKEVRQKGRHVTMKGSDGKNLSFLYMKK